MDIARRIKELDFVLIFAVLIIAGIGIVSLFSFNQHLALRQLLFLVGGLFVMVITSFIDWRMFRENSYLILFLYFVSLFSLYGLLLFGPTIRGVNRWYKIGDILIDPAEIFKIIILILLAKFFSKRHVEMYKISHILLSGFYVLLPAFFIFRQPDLGSALVIIVMWIGILIISGIKLKHFLVF